MKAFNFNSTFGVVLIVFLCCSSVLDILCCEAFALYQWSVVLIILETLNFELETYYIVNKLKVKTIIKEQVILYTHTKG